MISQVQKLLLEHEWTHNPGENFEKVYKPILCLYDGDTREANIAISTAYKAMVRLDVGCGARTKPGYIGIDIFPTQNGNIQLDLTKEDLPFGDSTVDAVYSDHFLEHLDIENVIKVMKEIHRVCKPRALVEIRVPHFSGFTNFYEFHKTSFRYNSFAEFIKGEWGMFEFNEQFELVKRKLNIVNRQSPKLHPITKYFIWNYPVEWLANKMPLVYELTGWRSLFPAWELQFRFKVIK